MKQEIIDKFTVYKDNRVIEAGYHLNLNEQRLILSVLGQYNPNDPLSEKDEHKISVDQYAQIFKLNKINAYHELKAALTSLFERKININIDNKESSYRWLSSKHYYNEEQVAGLCFSHGIIPYLSKLKDYGFTSYRLMHVSKMTSPNAIRLYEILVQRVDLGEREIHIDWLRNQLCLSKKYKSFGDFNTSVITPSLAQINKHSNINVEIKGKPLKKGRQTYGFVFDIKYKKGLEHKKLTQALPRVQKEKPQEPELPAVETNNPAPPLFDQAMPANIPAPMMQPKLVNNYYSKQNYGKKTELSTIDRLKAKVARDQELGMNSLSQHFN